MPVSHDHLTPFSVSLQRPEERNPRIMSHHVSHRLGRAATAGDRQEADHDEGQEEAAEEVPKEELKWRADIIGRPLTQSITRLPYFPPSTVPATEY